MKIYEQERKDGLEKILTENKAVAFFAELKLSDLDATSLNKETIKVPEGVVLASENNNNPILLPLNTIMVSTGINKNDAIFLKESVWAARHTPEDTPFNYMHDEKDIIGHITANKVVDENFKEIADDTPVDELPDKFHILTTAVLYRYWRDEKLMERMEQIIAEIEKGEWFVSMEALTDDFDYGLVTEKGELQVIKRTEDSSFLTKYLKCYGGSGVYDNCRVGRILKNIIFAGKGLVRKPANPDSVILANAEKIEIANELTIAELKMSVELETKVKELELKIKELADANTKLVADFNTANTTIKTVNEEKASVETERNELKNKLAEVEKTHKEVAEKSKGFEEKANELQGKLDKIESDKKVADRVSKFIAKGKEEAEAKDLVEKLVSLSDEQFDLVVAQVVVVEKKEEEKKEPTQKEIAKVVDKGLENTEKPVEGGTVPDLNKETAKHEEFKDLCSVVASLFTDNKEDK